MYCKKCGTKNDEDARFCFKCGTELTISKDTTSETGVQKTTVPKTKEPEFNDFQKIYVKKLKENLLECNANEDVDINEVYEKAKKYDIEKEEIDRLINESKQTKKEISKYISTVYEETPDFILNNEMKKQIMNYGVKLGLNEVQVGDYVEQYEKLNDIEEKIKVYTEVVDSLISHAFNTEFDSVLWKQDEDGFSIAENEIEYIQYIVTETLGINDKGKLGELEFRIRKCLQRKNISEKELDQPEGSLSVEKATQNVEKVKNIIEKRYEKLQADEDLSKKQVTNLIEIGRKNGLHTWNIIILILVELKKRGIYDRKRQNVLDKFDKKVDALLSEQVTLCGEKRTFEGKYFLENHIVSLIDDEAEEAVDTVAALKTNDPTALEVMIKTIVNCNNTIHRNIIEFAEALDLKNEILYLDSGEKIDSQLQEYIGEKCNDISAASDACIKIAEGAEFEKTYRELRKENRGKWVGGGFGLGGAIKGAAGAGVLNAGSGLLHSTVNLFGDMHTDNKAKTKIYGIVKEIRDDIKDNLFDIAEDISSKIIDIIYEKYPESFWDEDSEKTEISKQNFIDGNKESRHELAWELLHSNPEDVEIYNTIYIHCSSIETKKELIEIAALFGIAGAVRDELNASLDKLIGDIDIGISEGSKWLSELFDWIERRYDTDENECGKRRFDELMNQVLRKKRDDYTNVVNNIKLFEEENDWRLEPYIIKQIKSNLEEISEKFALSQKLDSVDIEIKNVCENTELDLLDRVTEYHQITDAYMSQKLLEASQAFSLSSLRKARIIKNKMLELQAMYFEVDEEAMQKSILKTRFEQELNDNDDPERLKEIKESLKNIEEDWEISVESLENRYEEKIELEERTAYDYTTDYCRAQRPKANLTPKKPGILCENSEVAENVRNQISNIYHFYENCDVSSYVSVRSCLQKVEKISQEYNIGKEVVQELKTRAELLDVEQRTVFGKTYSTIEDAEQERKMVVDGKRYSTVEEANRERQKFTNECRQLAAIEKANGSNAEKLLAIRKENFVSNYAKTKEKFYESLVVQEYYKALKQKPEVESARKKMGICIVLGFFAVILGINPFLTGGWGVKAIIGVIVLTIWGNYDEGKKVVKELKNDMEELKKIEKRFIIHGNEAESKK